MAIVINMEITNTTGGHNIVTYLYVTNATKQMLSIASCIKLSKSSLSYGFCMNCYFKETTGIGIVVYYTKVRYVYYMYGSLDFKAFDKLEIFDSFTISKSTTAVLT